MKFFFDECLEFATISSLLLFCVGGERLSLLRDLDLLLLSFDLLFFLDSDLFLFESFFLLLLLRRLRLLFLSFSWLRLLLRLSFSLLLLLLLLKLLLLLLLACLLRLALSMKSSEESDPIEELLFVRLFFFLLEAFPFLSGSQLLPSEGISITWSSPVSEEEERTSMG